MCGYVGVGPGHPSHGVHYDNVDVSVHGGLTFADGCHEPTREQFAGIAQRIAERLGEAAKYPDGDAARNVAELREQAAMTFEEWVADQQGRRICHVPLPGRPGDVWWLGFDCAHGGDVSPATEAYFEKHAPEFTRSHWGETYKDRRYVERQVANLAAQLAHAPTPPSETKPEPTLEHAER